MSISNSSGADVCSYISSEEYREEAAGDIPLPVNFTTTLVSANFYFIQATPSPVVRLGYVQQVESNLI